MRQSYSRLRRRVFDLVPVLKRLFRWVVYFQVRFFASIAEEIALMMIQFELLYVVAIANDASRSIRTKVGLPLVHATKILTLYRPCATVRYKLH